MLKKIVLISLIFVCTFLNAQKDTTVSLAKISETNSLPKKEKKENDAPPSLGDVFKPKISLGVGLLSFHGDLYAKHYQAPWTARPAFDLNISQRLYKPLQLNFNILFGKLGANEWIANRQENFQSEIRAGGLSLMYDFGNFISDDCRIRPWISAGVTSFEFLTKTDLFDKNGNKYYYWDDGSIKNIDQSAPTASLAVNLNRDYYYETDVRTLNKDGFGRYQERAWAFPLGVGALMKITDRFDLKMGVQYYFSTTDYIDGITNNSLGTRAGTKQKDNFVYTSFAIQYDLVFKKKEKGDTLLKDHFDGVDWLALDKGDYDEDGVRDWDDKCHGTPKGWKVDAFGCPYDDDKDGVPNEGDDELQTPTGMAVNLKGVSLDDDYWQDWYNNYMDSGNVIKKEVIENFYAKKDTSAKSGNNNSNADKIYTVELGRYNGPVPSNEMAMLLSIGDVKSTLLPDGSTVMYTAGNYKEIQNAIKRRDEFRKEGNNNAQVGYFKDGNLITLSDEEINKIINDNSMAATNGTNTALGAANSAVNKMDEDAANNEFEKGDIVFRIQLGAYKNRISKEIFRNAGNVLELKGDDNLFHYATKGYKTIENAASLRADLVVEGYEDAFITAYKDGKRIPLSATKATMDTKEVEDIKEIKSFSSVDKKLITFKVQLGALKKFSNTDMVEKTKDIKDIEKQETGSGMLRYTAGSFNDFSKADAYRQELNNKGFAEAFVIAIFKGEVISIQEAQELLK